MILYTRLTHFLCAPVLKPPALDPFKSVYSVTLDLC